MEVEHERLPQDGALQRVAPDSLLRSITVSAWRAVGAHGRGRKGGSLRPQLQKSQMLLPEMQLHGLGIHNVPAANHAVVLHMFQ